MRIKKVSTLVATACVALSMLAACGSSSDTQPSDSSASSDQNVSELSGQITAAGSTALQPLVKAAAESFMAQNPDVIVTVNGGGSGQGLTQVSDGAVNIGNSDVFAEEKLEAAKAAELVDHKVALVVIAPVVNADLGIDSLTKQQLADIFTGKVTNWKEVGGPDEKILLVLRPESSGTRALFSQWALDGATEGGEGALEQDDSGTLIQTVADNKGAIGYVAISYLGNNSDVAGLAIDSVEPTLENVYSGKYPVWGYEHMYTKGEPDDVSQAFLDYIQGEEFGTAVEEMGYGVTAKLAPEAASSHE